MRSGARADAGHLLPAARAQLGTGGAGNHYVDLFREVQEGVAPEASPVWIGIHFGSRGLGHRLATAYLRRGGGREGMGVPLGVRPAGRLLEAAYLKRPT